MNIALVLSAFDIVDLLRQVMRDAQRSGSALCHFAFDCGRIFIPMCVRRVERCQSANTLQAAWLMHEAVAVAQRSFEALELFVQYRFAD